MKGSPMYRNFGIGKPSPNKQATISSVSDSLQNKPNPAIEKLIKELEETQDSTNNANSAELQRRADQIQQNVSPKNFNKQVEEYNEKNSPSKQFEEGDYYDTRSKSPNKQTYLGPEGKLPKLKDTKENRKTMKRLVKERDEPRKITYPEVPKGQEEFREVKYVKVKSPNKQTLTSVSDSLQSLPNPSAEKLKKEYEKALKKLQEEAQEKLNANSDSTNQSNSDVLNKRANQIQQNVTGDEFDKQVDEYNEKNSPSKQTHFGGTKSEKGNIFTKKGRAQRKVNRYKRSEKKLTDNVNKEGFDTKKSKKLMKKTKKRLSKTTKLHQNVVDGKTVIQYVDALGNKL